MSCNGTSEPKSNFQTILKVVLDEHIVQLIILSITAQKYIKTIENNSYVQKLE
jgi:hypothetical protein